MMADRSPNTLKRPARADYDFGGSAGDYLRAFHDAHPEVTMTTGYMWLDFFS